MSEAYATDYQKETFAQLQANFLANMAAAKIQRPSIHEAMQQKKESAFGLNVDLHGQVNLAANGVDVYPPDIVSAIAQQIAEFENNPARLRINPLPVDLGRGGIHFTMTDKLWGTSPVTDGDKLKSKGLHYDKKNIGLLVVFGIGLGYHIKGLLDRMDIRQLILVDLDQEALRNSMHAMDWRPVFDYFSQKNRQFRIVVGSNPKKLGEEIISQIRGINLPLALNGFLYNHFDNEAFSAAKQYLAKNLFLAVSGWGFFDDNRASLVQGAAQILRGVPAFVGVKQMPANAVAFVLAAGPSLIDALPAVKRLRQNAIVISCGTALGILKKNGIVPDFHVEVERSYSTVVALGHEADEEYFDKIRLVAPNRAHGGIFKHFKQAFMFAKEVDAGGALLASQYQRFGQSNPTVSNGAMSFAVRCGFSRIYIAGMDFGFHKPEQHHAPGSIYFDEFDHYTEKYFRPEKTLPAIGGGEVFSTTIFAWSKASLEILLRVFPQVPVFNLGNGAEIEGTTAIGPDLPDVQQTTPENAAVISAIESGFDARFMESFDLSGQFGELRAELQIAITQVSKILAPLCADQGDLLDQFMALDHYLKHIMRPRSEILYLLIKGSMMHAQGIIYTHQGATCDRRSAMRYVSTGKAEILAFLQRAMDDIPADGGQLQQSLSRYEALGT